MSESEIEQAQTQAQAESPGRRFPCTCERGLGNALCLGCLHEANLGREADAPWKPDGNGGDV